MRGAIEYLVPFNKFRWMMVFVLPLILMYNGKKEENVSGFITYFILCIFGYYMLWLIYNISE